VLDQFNLITHSALSQDSYANVRPMTRELITPDEINGSFDYAVYAKSAAVIRMLQSAFGKDDFKAAMGNYIRTRLYGTTSPSFWFEELQRHVLVPLPATVKAIFESWSTSPGYPVVQATRNYVDSKVTISQKRFFIDGTQNAVEKYFVPITLTDASSPNYEHNPAGVMWLTPTANDMVLDFGKRDSWLLLNKLQHGFYRVNYDLDNWNLLIGALHGPNYTDIHHLNRASLLDDALNLARGGHITDDVAMDVLFYLKQETDFIPWTAAYNALTFLMRVFRGSSKFENLVAFVQNITSHSYGQTGFGTMKGDHVTELHRPNILYLACYVNVADCVSTSRQMVTQMLDDPLYVVPEHLQSVVFCAVAKYDNQLLDRLLAQLLQLVSGNPANIDKRYMYRLIGGMGCSINTEVLNK
jgi:aminopeptidase N